MNNSGIIYSSDQGLLLGFHGCDQSIRDKIITGQIMMKASCNSYDWLGSGMYFWQNNHTRAMNFAENPPGKNKIDNPAVLGAALSLGNCLDLTDKFYIDRVKNSYSNLLIILSKTNTPLPKNKPAPGSSNPNDKILRALDCFVIENLHEELREIGETPFDTVRCVFIEGNPIYEDSGFYDQTHIQVCVRNPNCIKGFFLPRSEDDNWSTAA
ncbi:hypothetical protein [Chitinophaga sancti]|uniref:Uncharacterized protein n=1 Tax=Chitinophaga sancti TaxID=1004 RepID=A0A1K1QF89_9BACT|nr:hypothetical protein [Chitinophaga sancti]WQD61401.1 hypothetical protein U0033_26350 [Chitinophaga sancti]WQG93046.1 hypothetical protein SR876_16110 [Chitinophaga sancti]SFW57870.1 hypothetical protein SAMN05661012_02721 [Chitinophaga sancti]